MKNRKIVVHVGLHKTASTYLQTVVFPRLRDVTYIGRPYTQENYAFNTLQYADDSLYDQSAVRREINRIDKEIAKGGTTLISDENLSGYAFYNFINRGMIAKRLSEVIPDAEIILFLRGQTDLIVSLYNQYVKIGWLDKHLDDSFLYKPGAGFHIEKWLKGNRDWDERNRFIRHRSLFCAEHFRYSTIYSLYSDLFRTVHVFLYEDFGENQKVCLERLVSILSSELPSDLELVSEAPQQTRVNKRLERNQLHAKLIRNRLSHISPIADSRAGRVFTNILSMILTKTVSGNENSNRAHVVSLLKECGIFSDNYTLNQRLRLGMEKYPEKYFGDGI